uniref:WhiB family transcriptional regulator n=1 Tax=Streptomyces scabiei TaxID=1930 RepID=UPI000E69439B|nr:WhiB family transcriptional regulator [Streptomyces scabiei]
MSNYTGAVPDTAGRRLDWMARGACTGERETFDDPAREHEARTICVARCTVRAECLAYVKAVERGLHRDERDGVLAGLTYNERHRVDVTASHRADDPPPLTFDGTERCGTHTALLRHLWLGEPIDSKCWSGAVYRDHDNRNWRRRTSVAPAPEALPEAS